jgi:hypothetical protein
MTSSLWLLLAGLCCFFAFFFIPGNPKYLSISSGILIAGAYFLTLLQDYKKKVRMPVLGVWLDHTKRPGLYKLFYVFLLFAGVFALFVFCLLMSDFGK